MTLRYRAGLPGLRAWLAVASVLLASCTDRPPDGPATARYSREQVEQGRSVYNFRCYYCHGYSGDAKTLAASMLSPPPMDFQAMTPESLSLARIRNALRDGRPGTAMKPFAGVITDAEQAAVAAFVHDEFVVRKARNTRYHTEANGWPKHERYRDAYPFALGEVALTVPPETLDPALRRGRALFMETCISCHDRGKPVADHVAWESRPLSYPRNNYDHRNPAVDASTSATPFRIHDVPPKLQRPTPAQARGEKIYQENCAFCHAADGTGKNWIGAFLEPHPRDLTDHRFRASMSRERYRAVIRSGLPGSSMPAWRDVLTDAQIEDLISYIEVGFNGKTIVSAPRPGG